MPPLAGNLVAVAALSTLANRGEELITAAGDLWIGLAELLQVVRQRVEVRHRWPTHVRRAAHMFCNGVFIHAHMIAYGERG